MRQKLDHYGRISFDLRETAHGGGAVRVADDQTTTVSYGSLYAKVTFKDLTIDVCMEPHEGEWHNATWAREHAWEQLAERLRPEMLHEMFAMARKAGERDGGRAARQRVREALGIRSYGDLDRIKLDSIDSDS